jgi:hypothetical protein
MATSTNYGWSEPDNSSLVKDGALAIRTLGNAIDVSLWSSGYGQAGKNKLINGDFSIWQRSTSAATLGYTGADRFYINNSAGTTTNSRETSVVPTGVRYALKLAQSGSAGIVVVSQPLESQAAIPLVGQTITVSAYVAASAATNFVIDLDQSTSVDVGAAGVWTTTSGTSQSITSLTYVRVSQTFTVGATTKSLMPKFAMNTLGAGNSFYIANVQMEVGSFATPFQTASGGSPQAELAMCQRYFQKWSLTQFNRAGLVYADATTNVVHVDKLPVVLRTTPTLTFTNMTANGNAVTAASVGGYLDTNATLWLNLTTSGVVAGTMYQLYVASGQTGVISYSSEL